MGDSLNVINILRFICRNVCSVIPQIEFTGQKDTDLNKPTKCHSKQMVNIIHIILIKFENRKCLFRDTGCFRLFERMIENMESVVV